ncbi:YafY family protein [Rubellicoccus peritrichatus]|uniref:YafY family protein n=1 Tax=Rubellicoccus peritrichatus TaxID=3080537 RepID=A0AAQ3LK34_9BACT|nr:YafY family protein [Puniceicoccus sp. CR14]WOO43729.1 YafY family protein [Puniceicoccus sp. CR14]
MNRIDRLTAMILMLQSQRVVTAEKISSHFEISVRTVYRDISALGEAGVPIVAEAGVGYSLMRGYNVPPIMFTEAEVAALFMSGEITEQFGDDSLKKSLAGALLKVRAALPDGHKNYLSKLDNSMEVWNGPNEMQSNHSLMPVQEAVVRRKCIAIHYDAGGRGEVTERTVEALGLTFYGRQWHLIAWCRLRKAIRDFRLDRMEKWEVLEETFSGHEDFSLGDFLKDAIEESALISFQVECECWALERILNDMPCKNVSHHELPNGRFLVEAKAYSLEWVAKWLIGMRSFVTARSPQELQDLIRAEAEEILRCYA